MNFWRAVEILNKRKWLIMFSVLATTVFTFGGTRLVGSKWQATVRFVAPQRSAALSAIGPGGGLAEVADSDGMAAIQAAKNQSIGYDGIVKSQGVLGPVLEKLHQKELPVGFLKNIDFIAVG